MAIRKVPSKGPGAKRKINPKAGKGSFGQDKIVAKVAKPIDDDITSESDHDMKDDGYRRVLNTIIVSKSVLGRVCQPGVWCV